ncbi:hypothetical protein I8J32_009230 [Lysobacter solisilvae]|uniref:Uncharacterized protein n=1 Tax=Agrilutibacter solisilvae TaxID=2763317 RepID=A0A975ATK6_9GAMM|nr:hypothetical protein [Lysobacter solisilvae]QSX80134.1 hypothetical protein I8J32_009230 [Lysobacter solisilvae]
MQKLAEVTVKRPKGSAVALMPPPFLPGTMISSLSPSTTCAAVSSRRGPMKNAVPECAPSAEPSGVRTWQIAEYGGCVVSATPRNHIAPRAKWPICVVSAPHQSSGV